MGIEVALGRPRSKRQRSLLINAEFVSDDFVEVFPSIHTGLVKGLKCCRL